MNFVLSKIGLVWISGVILKYSKLDFSRTGIIKSEIEDLQEHLKGTVEKVRDALQGSYYSSGLSFSYSPFDKKTIEKVLKLAQKKRKINPGAIFLIGIGGSSLGAKAVFEAVLGKFYNTFEKNRFYCADTIDSNLLENFLKIAENFLQSGREIFLIIVSKSGSTIETTVNAALFIDLLKRFRGNYQDFVTIITDPDSGLQEYAQKKNIDYLNIPKKVEGRYSVFTAAGLFPLAMLNIDIKSFCKGASAELLQEAGKSASIQYLLWQKELRIHDFFIFSPRLEGLGLWCRQLIAESLGRKFDLDKNLVNLGITPTLSIGTTDLHSMVQLYLSGPFDKFTTFINYRYIESIETGDLRLDSSEENLPYFLKNKSICNIKNAIFRSVLRAYEKENRSFFSLQIDSSKIESFGEFMYFKMLETVFLGCLLNINPFGQPQVELYKKEAKKILGWDLKT